MIRQVFGLCRLSMEARNLLRRCRESADYEEMIRGLAQYAAFGIVVT